MTQINTGIAIPKIKLTDWKTGAEGIIYKEVCQDWTPFLPVYETQQTKLLATQACVTFSALNTIETQLKQQGITNNGKEINLSDRFTAKMSGTTQNGNNMQTVLDSIRNDGWLLEEDWTWDRNSFTWDEFYAEIPQVLKDKAKQNLKDANWQVNYEWANFGDCHPDLESIKVQLKQSPLHRATSYSSGLCSPEHATELFKIDNNFIYIYDTYNGGIVKNPLSYCMPYLIKVVVGQKIVLPVLIPPITKDLKYGMMNEQEVKYLQQKLIKLGYLSKGLDTGNYLDLTKMAVSKFQWAYKVANPIVLLWNRGKLVSIATRNALNKL
jgi:hypothetical protein